MRYRTVLTIQEIAVARIKLRFEYSLFFLKTFPIISISLIVPYDAVKTMEVIRAVV